MNNKVVYLPPNTTSVIQTMDQRALSAFKANYLKQTFLQLIKWCDNTGDNTPVSIQVFWKQLTIKVAIENIENSSNGLTEYCMNFI